MRIFLNLKLFVTGVFFPLVSHATLYWDGSMDFISSSSKSDVGCDNYTITLPHMGIPKYTMCLRHSKIDILSNVVRQHGSWPECNPLQHLWKQSNSRKSQILKNNTIFVDVGGNIGSCSLFMAALGVNVLSFEPLPSNLFYFTQSVRSNIATGLFPIDRIKIYPFGVGNVTESVMMYSQPNNPGNSVVNITVPEYDHPGNFEIMHDNNFTISIIRLDDVLWPDRKSPPPQIDLMKVILF